MKLTTAELSLYKPVYRNSIHVRNDFADFLKDTNDYLKKTLPHNLRFRIVIKDHFFDRILDRKADTRYLKRMIQSALEKNLCEILYFSEIESETPRIVFTDSVHHIFCTWDAPTRRIIVRSYFYNTARHMGKNTEFWITAKI